MDGSRSDGVEADKSQATFVGPDGLGKDGRFEVKALGSLGEGQFAEAGGVDFVDCFVIGGADGVKDHVGTGEGPGLGKVSDADGDGSGRKAIFGELE